MMRRSWILVFLLLLGCGGAVRAPAREATSGILDALDHPDPHDRLAGKIHRLTEKYVDEALDPNSPPRAALLSREITEGALSGLAARAPEQRALVQALVRDAVSEALVAAKEQMRGTPGRLGEAGASLSRGLVRGATEDRAELVSLMGQLTHEAGQELARGASDELRVALRGELCPGAGAESLVGGAVAQATSGVLQGVTAQLLNDKLPCHESDPKLCRGDLFERASRSIARGMAEGVGQRFGLFALVLAGVFGVALALVGSWVLRRLGQRGFSLKLSPAASPGRAAGRAHAPRRRRGYEARQDAKGSR